MGTAGAGIVVGVHLPGDATALRRSLPTVVHQRVDTTLRVVVIDDGADADARSALEELVGWYPDVEVRRNERRLGRAAARNQVLATAGDAAVAWLDLGDVWHPRKLAVQHAALRAITEADAVLVTSAHRQVDLGEGTERVVVPDLDGDLRLRVLDRDLGIPVGTLLGWADTFRLLGGFDEELPYRDDEELLLRFLASGGRFEVAAGGAGGTGGTEGTGMAWSTGLSVRDHPTARDVAVAERRFRRLHGARMRALDPGGNRRAHRRELQRAARLHGKAGRSAVATAYRLRADLTAVSDRAVRAVSRRREVPQRRDTHAAEAGADDAGAGPAPTVHPDVPVPDELTALHEAARANAWQDALSAWAAVDEQVRRSADPISVELVARSFRALGRYADAIAVAEAGLRSWAEHPRIELELAKSRAATTDWSEALELAPRDATPSAGGALGAVTSLGSLVGEEGAIQGTVEVPSGALPPQVSLRVDGTTVVSTTADAEGRFALSCQQLREFLGDGDVLEVVVGDGLPLPLPRFGTAAQVRTGYPSRMPALRARLEGGAVFTKFGALRPGSTPARERRTLDLVDEVTAVVEQVTGRPCTPFYGNLLGAVREQGFIAHDVGGFDVGYVSALATADEVRAEFSEACCGLLEAGYYLEVEPFGALIRRAAGDPIFVDLNLGWATSDGELGLAYGWRHDPAAEVERIEAPRDTFLAGRLVRIPGDAEAILHQVYGPGWATPDQGFDVDHELRRDGAYLLTAAELAGIAAHAPQRVRILA